MVTSGNLQLIWIVRDLHTNEVVDLKPEKITGDHILDYKYKLNG